MNNRDLSMFIKFLTMQAIAKSRNNNEDGDNENTNNYNDLFASFPIQLPNTNNNTPTQTSTTTATTTTTTPTNTTTTITIIPNPNKTCKCKSLNEHTHTYCSTNCGCFKNKTGCNSKCLCKGQCGNGKSITDELFFRVWRNVVTRNAIIGDERRNLFIEYEERKAKVVDILSKKYGCSFINEYWTRSYIRRNSDSTIDSIAAVIVQDIKTIRARDIQNALRIVGITYRHNDHGDSIKEYIETMDEEKRKELPTIEALIEIEKDKLQNRKQALIDRLTKDGLGPFKETMTIREYLSNRNETSIENILEGVRQTLVREKLVSLGQKLSKKGFILRKDHPEVKKYILVFKPEEIVSLNVKTEEDIVKQEIEYNKKRRLLLRELGKNGLYFRKSSLLMTNFLDETIDSNTLVSSIEKIVQGEKELISSKFPPGKMYREEVLNDRLHLRGIPFHKIKGYEMFDHYLTATLKDTPWEGETVDDLITIYQEVAKDTSDSNSHFIYRYRKGYKESNDDSDEDDDEDSDEDDDSNGLYHNDDYKDSDDDDNEGEYDSDYYTDDSNYCYNCKTYHN